MEKDFDEWNNKKKVIESNSKNLIIKQGEIWWTSIGINIKTESCGKGENFRRPVLVLRKLSHENYIVIPLSTKIKTGTWFKKYEFKGEEYCALLYQIRMININRFYINEGKLEYENFYEIKKRLKMLLNL